MSPASAAAVTIGPVSRSGLPPHASSIVVGSTPISSRA
jgi:hypothetical protein